MPPVPWLWTKTVPICRRFRGFRLHVVFADFRSAGRVSLLYCSAAQSTTADGTYAAGRERRGSLWRADVGAERAERLETVPAGVQFARIRLWCVRRADDPTCPVWPAVLEPSPRTRRTRFRDFGLAVGQEKPHENSVGRIFHVSWPWSSVDRYRPRSMAPGESRVVSGGGGGLSVVSDRYVLCSCQRRPCQGDADRTANTLKNLQEAESGGDGLPRTFLAGGTIIPRMVIGYQSEVGMLNSCDARSRSDPSIS